MPRQRVHSVQQVLVSPSDSIIGLSLDTAHATAVHETESNKMTQKTRNDYCSRIQHFIDWIKTSYPDYVSEGIVELSPQQIADKVNYGDRGQ